MPNVSKPNLEFIFQADGRFTRQGMLFLLDMIDRINEGKDLNADQQLSVFEADGSLSGSGYTYNDLNNIFINKTDPWKRLCFQGVNSSGQTNIGDDDVNWDTQVEINPSYFGHSTTVQPHQVTILQAGLYRVGFTLNVSHTDLVSRRKGEALLLVNGTAWEFAASAYWPLVLGGYGVTLAPSTTFVEFAEDDIVTVNLRCATAAGAWGGQPANNWDLVLPRCSFVLEKVDNEVDK